MDKKFFGKKQYYGLWYEMFQESLCGMNIGTGGETDTSGEKNVLATLKCDRDHAILFDVGANIGEYTKLLLEYFPGGSIHSFEPSEKTYQKLKKNIQSKDVILNNIGLSDRVSDGILYYDLENSGLASLYCRQLDYLGIDFSHSEEVRLDTLDHYCEINHIEKIDLLKMDIEGHELYALKGASTLLSEKRISNIQIEFGGCNIDSRTYFKDFWNLLHIDFNVYRVLQDVLWEITKYSERLECFVTSNFLFVKK